ncbi:MAG TPA: GIY-YIG nuclease family protein, partial [Anaeromyxobacteraceae bacterium]|nr:GIY-YIG nuclease family protein [Anaeromyxobacteraceae bacterium]
RDASYYAGHTDDLSPRFAQHQAGEMPGHTRARRPETLVYSAEVASRDEAIRCEMRIKGWSRAKKDALIRRDWSELRASRAERIVRRGALSTPARRGMP